MRRIDFSKYSGQYTIEEAKKVMMLMEDDIKKQIYIDKVIKRLVTGSRKMVIIPVHLFPEISKQLTERYLGTFSYIYGASTVHVRRDSRKPSELRK